MPRGNPWRRKVVAFPDPIFKSVRFFARSRYGGVTASHYIRHAVNEQVRKDLRWLHEHNPADYNTIVEAILEDYGNPEALMVRADMIALETEYQREGQRLMERTEELRQLMERDKKLDEPE
jgi:hypothetical protein